jgi:hypothetical protein
LTRATTASPSFLERGVCSGVDNSAADLQPQEEPSDMEEQPQDEESSSSEEEMVSEAEGEAIWTAIQAASSDEEDAEIAKFAKNQTEQVMLRQLKALYNAETPEQAVRMCETIKGATEVSTRVILAATASHLHKGCWHVKDTLL